MGRSGIERQGCGVVVRITLACLVFLGVVSVARATITESQVLVVYNSAAPDAAALKDAYLAAHPGIPAANVLDLNNAALNVANITYAQFVTLVRNPIRAYLNLPGLPDPAGIVAITLIRPFPHRIYDTDNVVVGDNPGALLIEFLPPGPPNNGLADATCASVDAELVLLWQNLDAGEAGGPMDSKSDNIIDNPYHQSAGPIQNFTRTNIQVQKTFLNMSNVAWVLGGTGATRLGPGDMYLVCRIDGNSLSDASALISRAHNLYINKARVRIVLDEFDVSTGQDLDDDFLFSPLDAFDGGDDYEHTRNILQAAGWDVRYDGTFNFIDSTEETLPIIGYASYGENHSAGGLGEDPPGMGTYLTGFHFPPGAMFNTIESFNGRDLNGVGQIPGIEQEQVSHFVALGGTFGIGMVWEPFSFTVPDNEYMMPRMLIQGFTWGEAAYTSIPCLSWEHVVVGDPLGKATILNDPALPLGDLNGDGVVNGLDIAFFVDILINGPAAYHVQFPTLDPIFRGDFNGDFQVNGADTAGFVAALLAG